MATINSIRKQIETANKRIESFRNKIEMYGTRLEKAIESAKKATGINDITAENYDEKLRNNWEWNCKVGNNVGYLSDNKRYLAREIRNVENLTAELSRMEKAAADKESATAPLKAALIETMADFRTVWFERMNDWYSNHYDDMRSKLNGARNRYNRIRTILDNYFYSYKTIREHSKMYYSLKEAKSADAEVISDKANRMGKPEYMAYINENLVKEWNNGIDKLADKCKGFGVDESKVKATNPEMTGKGFAVILTDGTNRVIDARVIWAAEYSYIVTPHTRYIVTERRK